MRRKSRSKRSLRNALNAPDDMSPNAFSIDTGNKLVLMNPAAKLDSDPAFTDWNLLRNLSARVTSRAKSTKFTSRMLAISSAALRLRSADFPERNRPCREK